MTQPIDTAYVEIHAKGQDDTAREIAKALDKIAAEVKKLTQAIEKEFVQAGHEMENEVQQATKSIEKDFERQSRAAQKTGTSLALAMKEASTSAAKSIDDMADEAVNDLERVSRQALQTAATVAMAGNAPGGGGGGGDIDMDFGRDRDLNGISGSLRGLTGLASGAMTAVKKLANELGETLGNGAMKAGQAVGSLVGIVSAVLGPIGSLIASLGMLGVVIALTPVIIPVVAALAQLTGLIALLPGTIGFLAAALTPLIVAFQGVGGAVSALASGDLEKIEKAMKNIAPQARIFARELYGLRDEMKQLKFAVQDAFFEKFNGSLQQLVTRLLPTLKSGLSDVSGSLGDLAADLTDTLSSAKAVSTLNDLFDTTSRIIDDLRGPLMDVVDSLLGGMKASLPFVERMFKSLGDGMEKFAGWLNKAVEDGRFEKWLNDAFEVAKDLWDLLKSLGGLLGAVFSPDSADEGKSIIESITESVKELTEYLKSPEGKQNLRDMAQAGKDLAGALLAVTGWLTKIEGFFTRMKDSPLALLMPLNVIGRFEFFKGLWDDLWPKIKEFASSVGGWFEGAGKSIGDFFSSIGQWFQDAWNTVTEKGGEIVQWFKDLPGKIGEFMSQVPEKIQTAITTAFDNATYAVGYGIGAIVRFFIDLPGRIAGALTTFWRNVTDWFSRTRTAVVDTVTRMWNAVVDWFQRLPGRVSSAVSSIVEKVSKWFRDTYNRATRTVSDTVGKVVEWFQKLPGRAADAISKLPGKIRDILKGIVSDARGIGSDIMNGIADGIRNGWNAAIEAAKRAARNILDGFWDAFEIGSPSKLMAREVGRPLMQGIGVGVEDSQQEINRTINTAVNNTAAAANASAGAVNGGGSSLTIQNLTIPLNGTFDFTNPATARAVAVQIYEALQQLQREYR